MRKLFGIVILLALAGGVYYAYTRGLLPWGKQEAVDAVAQPSSEAAKVEDIQIRAAILESFMRSPELGGKGIEVRVENRMATLSGTVETAAQRSGAEQAAGAVDGVAGVTNNLAVANPQAATEPPAASTPAADPNAELAKRVEFDLYRTDAFDTRAMTIKAEDGTITLSGTVRSRAEQLLAERVAQGTPGVKKVVNQLQAAAQSPARR
jgi:hyperosmotically inducible protein